MTADERIAQLEAKIADLEEQLDMAYDDLDRRLEKVARESTNRLALVGLVISTLIGIAQIVIALVK